jgi:hypothetical protein
VANDMVFGIAGMKPKTKEKDISIMSRGFINHFKSICYSTCMEIRILIVER